MTKKVKKLGVKITQQSDSQEVNTTKNGEVTKDEEIENLTDDKKEDVEKVHKINKLLDKLTLEMLVLMEQNIEQKRKLEVLMTEGEGNLAKSRYILGHKNVSSLQLPTELSNDIDPAVTVEETVDERFFGKPMLNINIENFTKSEKSEETKNIQDPIHWFGVLVPRNLHMAQNSYRNALSLIVDCANNQTRLNQICIKIQQLRELRDGLKE